MKIEIIKNKVGEVLTTKEGKQLTRTILELGDEFIPNFDEVIVREKKGIKNYTIQANVRDKEGNVFKDVYLTLMEGQAKKIKSEEEPNQKLWRTYTYENEHGKGWIGITCKFKKQYKPPKTFADFEKKDNSD